MSKTYSYIITLKKSTSPQVFNVVIYLLLFIAVASFIYPMFLAKQIFWPLLFSIILTIVWTAFVIFRPKKEHYYRWALLVAGIGWMLFPIQKYLIGTAYIVLGLLEKQVKFPAEIGIDKEGIVINSLPKKYYTWSEIRHIIIKDNILTIDFNNNKLLQKEIQDFVSPAVEQEFNSFCAQQMSTADKNTKAL